jgi:hypothetical protein
MTATQNATTPRKRRPLRSVLQWLLVVPALAAAATLLPAGAAAQPVPPPVKDAKVDAETRFRRGVELYQDGDFAPALIEWRRAYDLEPNFRVLYNIAQVQYQLGDYASALRTFERYLAEGGVEIQADRRTAVEGEIAKLRLRVGRLDLSTTTAGVEIAIDDIPVGRTPLDGPVAVSAGRRRVVASRGGQTVTRIIEVGGGDLVPLRLDLPDPSAGDLRPATPLAPTRGADGGELAQTGTGPTAGARPGLWFPWATTGVLAAGATVTGILTIVASEDLETQRETFGSTRAERESTDEKRRGLALSTDLLAGAAVIMGGISVYMTFFQQDASPQGRARAVQVAASPTSVVVFGSF